MGPKTSSSGRRISGQALASLPRDQTFSMGRLPLENGTSALALSGSQQKQVPNNLNSNGTESKPKKKICCACPDTKKLRDECIVQHGEDACAKWIEAHRQCLGAEGFNF